MEGTLPLEFSVRYRLGEYLRIVRAHMLAKGVLNNLSGLRRAVSKAVFVVIGTVLFLFKSYRVGTCHFTIDAEAVSRRSKTGLLRLPWSEVVAVYQYEVGYLIFKDRGAMPIPFRVLSPNQREGLAALVAPHLHAT